MSPCKLTNQAVVRRLMHSLYHCLSWLSSIGISLIIIILNNNNDHFQHKYSQKAQTSALRIRRKRGLHVQKSSYLMFYTQSRYDYIGAIQKPNKAYIYIKLHTHTHARTHARTHAHTHTHTRTHARTHTHTHTHTRTHACKHSLKKYI